MTEGMACDECQGVRQRARCGDAEQQGWQQRLEHGMYVSAVDASVGRQFMAGVGRQGGQSLQVVAQHPGGEILCYSPL